MTTNLKYLSAILCVASISFSSYGNTESEYVIDFSSNQLNLPTAFPSKDEVMPLNFELSNGGLFSIENQGVRYNQNESYKCVQISNSGSAARMYGCFSITAPANSRITYVDFIGMDPDNTRNCRDLLSGPFEDNTGSSAESMNGPWEDIEGRTKLYFKYVFNPAAVGSAYIKQIILHLDTDDSNPDEGDENGDIENGGDENGGNENGGDETPSLIELRHAILAPIAGTADNTDFSAPLIAESGEVLLLGIFSSTNNDENLTLLTDNLPEGKLYVSWDYGDNVDGLFQSDRKDNTLSIIGESSGIFNLSYEWDDTDVYKAGKAQRTLILYKIINTEDLINSFSVSIENEDGSPLLPGIADYNGGYAIIDTRTDKRNDMRISLKTDPENNVEIYYNASSYLNDTYSEKTVDYNPTVTPKNLVKYENGYITLPGDKGIIEISLKTNGVFSPVYQVYYAKSLDILNGTDVKIEELPEEVVNEYFDLSGRRIDSKKMSHHRLHKVSKDKNGTKILIIN